MHRVVVTLWYVPCVLVPLIASMTSPVWYVVLVHPGPRSVDTALGFLAASWAPWAVAALGTMALAVKYELGRHPRGRDVTDAWDTVAVHLLGVTGAAGALVSMALAGLVLEVVPS